MLFSEKEARKKTCPLRAELLNPNRERGDQTEYGHVTCTASDCMAWREVKEQLLPTAQLDEIARLTRTGYKHAAVQRLVAAGVDEKSAEIYCEAGDYSGVTRTVGYCGAFGRPEGAPA